MNKRVKENGITLIALVITIIVLLILAGVSIAMLAGENGIITQAQNAKNKTEEAEDKEKIGLAMSEAQIGENEYQKLDEKNFKKALENQFEGRNLQLSDNGDGSFLINLDDMNKMYYADSNGQIISDKNMVRISTTEELNEFRNNVNNGNTYNGWYIYLANDITLDTNEEWEPIGIYQEDSTNPNDEGNIPFNGIFDGHFHTISGMHTNSSLKNRGLFGFIKEATVKNVGIVNGNIQGTSRTGAIVGYAYKNSKIINCFNSSNIIATDNYCGGIVGFINNETVIESCYNNGNVTSSSTVGGIVGGISNSTVKNCYNAGMIEGSNVGGISFAVINNALIENCYNAGTLTSTNATSINCSGNDSAKVSFKNNYYLENTINGANDKYEVEQNKVKNNQEMKLLASTLGSAFKENSTNINNGFPVLEWQII